MIPAEVRAAAMSVVRGVLGMEITHKPRSRLRAIATQFLLGIAGLALITFVCFQVGFGLARTGFAYVILVALVSLLGSFSTSVILSLVAAVCLNYFFAPPLFELRVDSADDIVRIAAFLTTSLVVTALITKRKRAEEDLVASKARLEAAQRIAHVGWWERDFTTTHVTLSDEACRVFGVQPVDLPEWHGRWLELIHPDDRPRVAEAAAAALVRDGPRYDIEYRVVRPDGTERIVHSQGDVTWDESGKPLRQFGVLQDITQLRQAEEELRESEERFRTLVQFSFDAYWETDAQHRFSRQEFAEGLPEAPARDEIGKTRWEVPYLEPDAEGWRKHRETIDAHLPFRDFEIARPTPDGGKRYVSASGLPVFDKSGRFVGYRGVARNITERKRAEEALRRSEAYLAEAQRLSHTGTLAFNATAPVFWSEESYRIWGLDPRQGLPNRETVLQRIHPEDRERVNAETEEALRQKRGFVLEFRIVLPDGTVKYIEVDGPPLVLRGWRTCRDGRYACRCDGTQTRARGA